MNSIQFEINNNRTMQLLQRDYDKSVEVTMFNNQTKEIDFAVTISPGDMIMFINYYLYVKNNNLKCDFVNPNGEEQ